MQKIFNADIMDLFPVENGLVYAAKETLGNGNEAVTFHNYDMLSDSFERIPVNSYITKKFGENGFNAARNLGDFITCKLEQISSSRKAASYANGSLITFDESGTIIGDRVIKYMGNPASSPVSNGRDLWMVVTGSNSVINYSMEYNRIEFRIGSPKEKSFSHPCDLSLFDNRLYICNSSSYKIRTIDLTDYNVRDYYLFNEPVYKYFRIKDKEFARLKSGIYIL